MLIGSLFSGAGGLDLAIEKIFSHPITWQCENDPAAIQVLDAHWPDTPNLGDITHVDWDMEPVDILCGGFPCSDVSKGAVDRRRGFAPGTRSGLWSYFAAAIAAIRPPLVVIENVRGLLNARAHRTMEFAHPAMGNGARRPLLRAAGAVFGDLADLGYDAQWATTTAASVGAPHGRERVFIVAIDTGNRRQWRTEVTPQAAPTTPVTLLPTPSASDGIGGGPNNPVNRRAGKHSIQLIDLALLPETGWDKYQPAIRRWETLTRPAPPATEPTNKGTRRLNSAFSEWLMGWQDGWVTAVPGLTRDDQLRLIGNGCCPQQVHAALAALLPASEVTA